MHLLEIDELNQLEKRESLQDQHDHWLMYKVYIIQEQMGFIYFVLQKAGNVVLVLPGKDKLFNDHNL